MFSIGAAFGSKRFKTFNFLKKKKIKKPSKLISNTGPKNVYLCSKNQDTVKLGIAALKNLSKKTKLDNAKLLISVTETPKKFFPGNSFEYASSLNLNKKMELIDLNSGCSGFLDALSLSYRLKKKALIVCSENYSSHMKNRSQSTFLLFSDAASAIFVNPGKFKILYDEVQHQKNSFNLLCADKNGLFMNGPEVFFFTKKLVIPMLKKTLLKYPSIKYVFCHQASLIVLNTLKSEFKNFKIEIPTNIKTRGNTVSSSIPILLKDTFPKIKGRNSSFIMLGFGVGLQCRIMVIEK